LGAGAEEDEAAASPPAAARARCARASGGAARANRGGVDVPAPRRCCGAAAPPEPLGRCMSAVDVARQRGLQLCVAARVAVGELKLKFKAAAAAREPPSTALNAPLLAARTQRRSSYTYSPAPQEG
jgi:hypothetical protein